MGACDCNAKVSGYSANTAYEQLVNECVEEYGNNSYSGSFNTCDLVRVHRLFDKYSEKNEKKAYEYLYKLMNDDRIDKWTAHGVDLGVKHYEVIKAKFNRTKGAEHLQLMFFACGRIFKTWKEAQEYAMKKAVEDGKTYTVSKGYYLPNGSNILGTVDLETKTYKSRPKSVPKGAVLKEVHEYVFVGLAAC